MTKMKAVKAILNINKVVKVEETQDGIKAKTFSVLNITGCFFR